MGNLSCQKFGQSASSKTYLSLLRSYLKSCLSLQKSGQIVPNPFSQLNPLKTRTKTASSSSSPHSIIPAPPLPTYFTNWRPTHKMLYKAVLFDMGGVLVRYRDPSSYERLLEMAGEDPNVAKQIKEFDYGKISAEEIVPLMRLILPDFPKGVTEYSAVENYTQPNEDMLRVVRRLKKAGLKVALVTNNGFWSRAKERTMLLGDISHFDVVVESCKCGFRKPDSEIFNLAVERLQVAKEECIFLDDSKENCEGAERQGIHAIYVEKGNTKSALAQLEHLLGISLSGRAALVTIGCEMNLTDRFGQQKQTMGGFRKTSVMSLRK